MFPHMKKSDPFPEKLVMDKIHEEHDQHQHQQHDDYDDNASEFTLLSDNDAYSIASYYDSDDDDSSSSSDEDVDPVIALTAKLNTLKKNFAARDKLLSKISRNKSQSFTRLLQKHEGEVRGSAQERILLQILYEKKKKKDSTAAANEISGSNGAIVPDENNVASSSAPTNKKKGGAPRSSDLISTCTEEDTITSKSTILGKIIKAPRRLIPKLRTRKRKVPTATAGAAPTTTSKNNNKDEKFYSAAFDDYDDNDDDDSDDNDDDFVDAVSSSQQQQQQRTNAATTTTQNRSESIQQKKKRGGGGSRRRLRDSSNSMDHMEEELLRCRAEKPKKRSRILFPFSYLWETIVFELHTTVPAVLSMILYCVAHMGIYQGFSYVVNKVTVGVYDPDSMKSQDILYFILFALGAWLVRLSGYLYWFLNPTDYDCVKFDFHNRLRLGKYDARCLLWIVKHDLVRGTIFTAGYYLAYIGVDYFHDRVVDTFFDETDYVMENLPSRQHDMNMCLSDLPPEVENSTYSFQCQHEMERLEERYQAIKEADVWYTYGILSTSSYEGYWYAYNEGLNAVDSSGPLLTANMEFVVYVGSFVLSLAALTAYGFIFWYKY